MAKRAPKLIKFEGSNNDLFTKVCCDDFSVDDKVIIPETHYGILIKDGELLHTNSSGGYDIFETKTKRFLLFFKKKIKTSCTVDVIYLSKTYRLKVLWGTNRQLEVRDPITDIVMKVGVSGEFEVQIADPRKAYLELIGVEQNYDIERLKDRLKGRMLVEVEDAVSRAMREKNLSYNLFGEHKKEISAVIMKDLDRMFRADYGLKLFSFTLTNVTINEESKAQMEAFFAQQAGEPAPAPAPAPAVEKAAFCPVCGTRLNPEFKLCPTCGKALD